MDIIVGIVIFLLVVAFIVPAGIVFDEIWIMHVDLDKRRKAASIEIAHMEEQSKERNKVRDAQAQQRTNETARYQTYGSLFGHITTLINENTVMFNLLENDEARRSYLAEKMQPYMTATDLLNSPKYRSALSTYLSQQSKLHIGNGYTLNPYVRNASSIDDAINRAKARSKIKQTQVV